MLKYKILNNNNNTEMVSIDFESRELNEEKDSMTFFLLSNDIVKNNDIIIMESTVIVNDSANNVMKDYHFQLTTEAIVDKEKEKQFSINIPTSFPLTPNRVTAYDSYYIMEFETPHFFPENASVGERRIYMSNYLFSDADGVPIKVEFGFEYVSVDSIRIEKSALGVFETKFEREYHTFDYEREDFRFTNPAVFSISKRNSILNIPLLIENKFQTDLFKEDLLTTNFVEKEKKKVINRIVDMEKQVYYPAYHKNGSNMDFIDKIVFNLHFRERSGDDWLVEKEKFWNGTKYDGGTPSAPTCSSNSGNTTYHSPSNQSDLLHYLNFNNNDVRYQKNKLKKSFLRLLFYDSTNQTNQNLLYTSTIFVDSGDLFGKFCKYIEDEPYLLVKDDEVEKVVGIKVDREPSFELLKKYDSSITNSCSSDADEARDELRLSTQMTVQDKFNDSDSSEGFYLYLFTEDDPKMVEKTIYMKVEFNHAGYGRTLPFMYPTSDQEGADQGKPLSFGSIVKDIWDNYKNPDGEAVGYPVRKYYSYSYIKLKCVYDKKLKKHIYYFDAESESDGGKVVKNIDKEERKMIINLYEAKVG